MNHMRGLIIEMLNAAVTKGYELYDSNDQPFNLANVPVTSDEDLLSVYNNAIVDMAAWGDE